MIKIFYHAYKYITRVQALFKIVLTYHTGSHMLGLISTSPSVVGMNGLFWDPR